MFYRENGQFKTSYRADQQVFPIAQDRIAIALLLVSKLVNSQAAAIAIVMPLALKVGMDPVIIMSFISACYGYFFLPTYPSDLACIGFDRSGTTRIGKFVLNHSFMLPGLIGVICACGMSFVIAHAIL